MKYEARITNVDGIGTPSVISLNLEKRDEAIENFRQLRLAHGDQSVLKLKLIEIDDSGNENEVSVT